MYTRIKAFYPFKETFQIVTFFGYATKSFPGVEVCGLGKQGKSLKEKFIYLCKELGIKIPIKRIVLCLEEEEAIVGCSWNEKSWLELPLFILFLSLIEEISMEKLDDCFSMGTLSVEGRVRQVSLSAKQWQRFMQQERIDLLKYIGLESQDVPKGLKWIPLDRLLHYPGKLEFISLPHLRPI